MEILILTQVHFTISKFCPYKGTNRTSGCHEGKHIVSRFTDGKWNGSCPLSGLVCDEHLQDYLRDGYYGIVPRVENLNEGVVVVSD